MYLKEQFPQVESIYIKVINTNAWPYNRMREICYSTNIETDFHIDCPMNKCLGDTSGISYKHIIRDMIKNNENHRKERLSCGGYGGYNLTFHCDWYVILDISIKYIHH